MSAATSDFDNTSVFDIFAVLATKLAVRIRCAFARTVRTLVVSRLVGHRSPPMVPLAPLLLVVCHPRSVPVACLVESGALHHQC